ncbi:MAG: anthranilate phosphoribosyltransferase [Kiritimatiellae bacterium]|nr:anthranilate phosphoribosyltransferase [Kiritimatiellia bacterium]
MILVIDNYDSFTYNIVHAIASFGAEVKTVRNDKADVGALLAMKPEAVVISPGPGNPDSAGVTLDAIRAFAGKTPIFGICLGHQAIAQAFGGKIVRAKKIMHGKTSRLRHDGKGVFAGVEQGFAAMRYHSLAVDRASLPDELAVTAESEDGEIMGLRHKTLAIESVQYHPESVGTQEGMRQIANIVEFATGRRTRKTMPRTVRRAVTMRALDGATPDENEAEGFFSSILEGEVEESELAAFLTAIAKNPVTPEELAGAARAMREAAVKIDLGGLDPVDIVGTGADGSNSFNVSTCAAFIAAGAGVTVAKHGNVASTSQCGSADVLAALGINLGAGAEKTAECIKRTGVGFLFAKNLHPAMKFAAGVRRMLGFRTLFNLIGPLTNPASVRRHVIGVPQEKLAITMANALKLLGSTRAIVVTGAGGLDEISPDGFTFVSSLENGSVKNTLLDAGGAYGKRFPNSAIRGADSAANAEKLLAVLDGKETGACRAAAIENAAAAIIAGGITGDYSAALALAGESIDSGRAAAKLAAMKEALK